MTIVEHEGERGAHILVVEDSPTQAVKLEHLLVEHGYVVSVKKSGVEALEFLKSEKPDVIISDIIMPGMDGYEFCRTVKADSALSKIPIILLTSLSDPGEVINGILCGADNFLTKPYKEQFILSRVAQVIANQEFRQSGIFERGIEIYFAGEKHYITSNRFQIIDLLFSTFENAIQKNRELDEVNKELRKAHDELQKANSELLQLTLELDDRVVQRTEELEKKNEELRMISQQLMQAEKLATIGELASSIAHELNNPLATVSLRVESLLSQTSENAPQLRELEIIGQEVERMGDLVNNLLQFSRRSQPQISTVIVCEEIEKTLELISYHLRKCSIKVVMEFAPDVPAIHADRQKLRQMFLNLFMNAADAMPQGGTLTIRVYTQGPEVRDQETSLTPIPDPRSPIPGPEGEAFVIIEISDTGDGIPPEILPRVTEPFYTTKPEGKGTGLGLSICRRIVQEHNGAFSLISEGIPGKGTTARISLPVKNGANTEDLR